MLYYNDTCQIRSSTCKRRKREWCVGCWIMYPTTGLSLRFWRMSTSTTIPSITLHTNPPLFFFFFPYFSCFPSTFHSFSSFQHYFASFNSYLFRIMREIIHVQAGKLPPQRVRTQVAVNHFTHCLMALVSYRSMW